MPYLRLSRARFVYECARCSQRIPKGKQYVRDEPSPFAMFKAERRVARHRIRWKIPLHEVRRVWARHRKRKKYSGLVNIGPKRNWLYSRKLFPTPNELETKILDLVERGQSA